MSRFFFLMIVLWFPITALADDSISNLLNTIGWGIYTLIFVNFVALWHLMKIGDVVKKLEDISSILNGIEHKIGDIQYRLEKLERK